VPDGPERTRRNFDSLSGSHLSDGFVHLGLLEVEREMHILACNPRKIAVGGRTDVRLVERELLAVFQQKCLHISIRPNLKLGRAGGHDDRPAVLHIHLMVEGWVGAGLAAAVGCVDVCGALGDFEQADNRSVRTTVVSMKPTRAIPYLRAIMNGSPWVSSFYCP
jgi:hypothetical protein